MGCGQTKDKVVGIKLYDDLFENKNMRILNSQEKAFQNKEDVLIQDLSFLISHRINKIV